MKTIGLCCDHAGFELKEFIKDLLQSNGWVCKDYGTDSADSCDYPDFAHALAEAVENDTVYPGVAICGSGNGISITLNKHRGIRAALCWDVELAELARSHNDANILVMPGRFITKEKAEAILNIFLATSFEGGRHQARIDKIPL